jgi:hypothetical protein
VLTVFVAVSVIAGELIADLDEEFVRQERLKYAVAIAVLSNSASSIAIGISYRISGGSGADIRKLSPRRIGSTVNKAPSAFFSQSPGRGPIQDG